MSLHVENTSFFRGPISRCGISCGLELGRSRTEVESLVPVGRRWSGPCRAGQSRNPRAPGGPGRSRRPLGIASAVHRVSAPLPVTVYPARRDARLLCALPEIGLKHDWGGRYGLPSPGRPSSKASGRTSPANRSVTSTGRARPRPGSSCCARWRSPPARTSPLLLDAPPSKWWESRPQQLRVGGARHR